MSKLFIPPTVDEGPIGGHRLFYFYTMERGISVLKIDGQYVEVRDPSQDEEALATEFYLGGHEYIVSDEVGAALEAAGYEVYDV
jgi:hypothetical protein